MGKKSRGAAEIWALFRESDKRREEQLAAMDAQREKDRADWEKRHKELNDSLDRLEKSFGFFGNRSGQIVEDMIRNGLLPKFQEMGLDVTSIAPRMMFKVPGTKIEREIDFLLQGTGVSVLVECKTRVDVEGVDSHMERTAHYRRFLNSQGDGDSRKIVGAIYGVGFNVDNDGKSVRDYVLENGLYVIEPSGTNIVIVAPSDGKVKEW